MLELDGKTLTLDQLEAFLDGESHEVVVGATARERILAARTLVEEIVARHQVVYGINTGFGKLARTKIGDDRLRDLQRNLLLSHAVGVGPPLGSDEVRLALLLRANALSRGHSGVRLELVELLLALLREDVLPVIPEQGSVGASGDLAPLAHLALVLIGEGEATVDGERLSGREALAARGLEPVELEAKEGLALINGTQISAAIGAVAWLRAARLLEVADLASAMTIEALRGSLRPFDERVGLLRPHPGHLEVAAAVRGHLRNSEIVASHAGCDRVQDQYSLRCVPQVHGAARDALRHVGEVLGREINAVTDNPLIFPDDGDVISAGNFHAEPIALPFDYATIATAEIASISERRIESMVNPDLSGLPPFLVRESGINSGFMIAQVTAAALVSENKGLAHPASVDSIPTSANQEDHVSMATIAARKLRAVVENTANVLTIELLAARQALTLGGEGLRAGDGVEAAWRFLEAVVPPLETDRYLKKDMDAVRATIDDGSLLRAVVDARRA